MGCANPEGATGFNIARLSVIEAGCPVTTAGTGCVTMVVPATAVDVGT